MFMQQGRKHRNMEGAINVNIMGGYLKCYFQILCGGSGKNVRFWLFCIDWWQTDKKLEILTQSCKDLFIWT